MSILTTHIPALVSLRLPERASADRTTLSLQRTSHGWALLDEHDHVLYQAVGPDARRRCLAQARSLGILRLTFDEQLSAA